MRDAVIVEAVRTPVGRARRSRCRASTRPTCPRTVLRALQARTGIDPALVDDVIWGCVSQVGEQTFDIARTAVLSAGWPESVPGTTVDRQCGSSQQAIHFAAAGIVAGHYDMVVAGGVESMSRVPMGSAIGEGGTPIGAGYAARYGPAMPNQGLGAEMIAERWGLSRARLDEFALASHAKAAAAIDEGRFARRSCRSRPTRASSTPTRASAAAAPSRSSRRCSRRSSRTACCTPATARRSATARPRCCCGSDTAGRLGLTPIARVHTAVLAADDPEHHADGADPGHAQGAAARRPARRRDRRVRGLRGVRVGAARVAARDRRRRGPLNVSGGAIALGHPLGASGARLATTLLHHMRDDGLRYGLQTMCEGGGQSNATVFELV